MPSAPDPDAVTERFGKRCNFCGQPIVWANTITRDKMPLDAAPSPHGNVRVHVDGRKLACDVIGKQSDRRKLTLGGWPLYRHHGLSCLRSDQWGRGAAVKPPAVDTVPEEAGLW